MRLLSVVISGYKRFATPQTLYLGPRVVAVVGPNEAGKTSLLAALSHLPANTTFDRREFTGRQQPAAKIAVVSGRYQVEDRDRCDIAHLLDVNQKYMFTYVLVSDGGIRWELQPDVKRDITLRATFSQQIADLNEKAALVLPPSPNGDPDEGEPDDSLARQAEVLATVLSEATEDLNDEQLAQLDAFHQNLVMRVNDCADSTAASTLVDMTNDLHAAEREDNPRAQIYRAVASRLPQILEFSEAHRTLQSDYIWSSFSEPPPPLANLLHLASGSYDEYRMLATDRDRREELSTFERRLNRLLRDTLSVWSQSKLTITLRADHESLAVHVTDEDTDRDVLIEERSAGLRMFASLLAFCARYAGAVPPILLFDEAETHLHYGAQADLMDVFATQNIAQAVIYTTHSIGCLPEDLGRSIRVVAPIGNEESEIRNEFWSGGVGLTPLMLAMGASAVAFSPARYAVLGEGPTEAILLPSLFRAAYEGLHDQALGFQVASGTAEIPADLAPEFESEAGNVAYVFDADDGGRRHAEKLAARAHNEGRVFVLGKGEEPGLCTEDMVASITYVAAVNEILTDTRNTKDELQPDELSAAGRAAYVDDWCRARGVAPLSKARIAERILRISQQSNVLIEPNRKPLLATLYCDLLRALRAR